MTIDELYKKLDDDLSWRKFRISCLFISLQHNDENNDALLESIILILYAYWEGYIKNISKLYLDYISSKKISHSNLSANFICISIRKKAIFTYKESFSIKNQLKFHMELDQKKKDVFSSQDKTIINTKANLNYKAYKNILITIGINCYEALESREKYFDKFLHTRNSISHGDKIYSSNNEVLTLTAESVTEIKKFILEIMSKTQDTIKEYAEHKFYLIENQKSKEEYDVINNNSISKFLNSIDD